MKLSFLGKYSDLGLLFMRLGLGVMMVFHGWPKLAGGAEKWEAVGGAIAVLGITFAPVFWGLMAALAETIGGVLLAVGFLTRLTCLTLAFVMLVATLMHLHAGEGLKVASHAIEVGIVFVGLVFIGPGKFSIDRS